MARVLIIDDDPKICLFLSEMMEEWGHQAASSNLLAEGRRMAEDQAFDLVLLDLELPDGNGLTELPALIKSSGRPEVIIITGTGDVRGAELAFKYGAWDFIQKPFTKDEVKLPVNRALAYRSEKQIPEKPVVLDRAGIIGESAAIVHCLEDVARTAVSAASVLVTGETGTGKELFARAIHRNSACSQGVFVPIDCGGIAESLAESIFFGHMKGAFTGATVASEGIIQQADGGTLFLDEVGDLPLTIQKSLLRALQEKQIRPIGAKREIAVDFRLIAATNRDLKEMVARHEFREDLLFRIGAISVSLPPLRDRGKDIAEIAVHKIHQICDLRQVDTPGISAEFLETLAANHWPGNVRELINVLEYSLASYGQDPTLHPKHLPPEYRTVFLSNAADSAPRPTNLNFTEAEFRDGFPTLKECRAQAELEYLTQLIARAGGDRAKACKLSGISQARLYALMKKYGLSL